MKVLLSLLTVGVILVFAACSSTGGDDSSSSPPSTECEMTAFSIVTPAVSGSISGTSISVILGTLPSGTSKSSLVATFTVSAGATVKVGSTVQVSGTTANDFTSTVTYVVTAENGTAAKNYAVTANATFSGVTALSSGKQNGIALKTDVIWIWGANNADQVNGTANSQLKPVLANSLTGVTAVSGGYLDIVALKSDGTVWTWGMNDALQLGRADTTIRSSTPVAVSGLSGISAIASGYAHNLALTSGGAVYAWGANLNGQLGDGNKPTNTYTPVQVLTGVAEIAGGDSHTLVVRTGGSAYVWGKAGFGSQTGTDNTTPTAVTTDGSTIMTGVSKVACGSQHNVILKTDGTVWTWGDNTSGQLGKGTSGVGTGSLFPVQVTGLTGVTAISAGNNHTLALKSDGTVWTWGDNFTGQLGNGTSGNISPTAVQVAGLTGITAIAAGNTFSIALTSGGTIYAWGSNSNGELGIGSTISKTIPALIQD